MKDAFVIIGVVSIATSRAKLSTLLNKNCITIYIVIKY